MVTRLARAAKRGQRRAPVELGRRCRAAPAGGRALPPSSGPPPRARSGAAAPTREAMNVLVAATLSSGPAPIGSTMSHASASGLSVSLTRATVSAPAARAAAVVLDEVVAAAGLRDRPGTADPADASAADRRWRCSAPPPRPGCRDSARSGACRRSRHAPSCRARRSPRPAAAAVAAVRRAPPAAPAAPRPAGRPLPAPRGSPAAYGCLRRAWMHPAWEP